MRRDSSLVRRVAWGSALGAALAALLAAFSTSALGALLILGAEDRRLQEAAVILADLIAEAPPERVPDVVTHEKEEIAHSGILLVAFREDGTPIAGDHNVGLPATEGCVDDPHAPVRVCRAGSQRGVVAVAASPRSLAVPVLGMAALAAAALAGLLVLIASSPLSRWLIAPLSRLRIRIAAIDLTTGLPANLGEPEHVVEVDALRETIRQLVVRVGLALEQAQTFAANAAHELRTPLSSVQGELELLAERTTEVDARADLRGAQRKLGDLAVLVERLLILATPQAKLEEHEVVSLRDLVEDSIATLPPSDAARVAASEADAVVTGDAVLLATMVANALGNALKYGEHATIELRTVDGQAVLRFQDDGPGLPEEERERVFSPFFRTEGATRRRIPGHGLGLALIRHIARTHGGEAAFIDSKRGGALLEIRLPVMSDAS